MTSVPALPTLTCSNVTICFREQGEGEQTVPSREGKPVPGALGSQSEVARP